MSGGPGGTPHVAFSGQVVCTLAEGHYFHGVAALANSLVQSRFSGLLVVGYRSEKPAWLAPLHHDPATDTYAVTGDLSIRLIAVPGFWHLNNCKPDFIRAVLREHFPAAELVYYFDSDIVITGPWPAFANWAKSGIVAALDPSDSNMPPHHAYRIAWRDLAARQGRACRDVTGYVNGGCVGIHRAFAGFADIWCSLMLELERTGADMRKMKDEHRQLEFSRMDQDVLNAAIMASDTPIVLLGYESMGQFPWTGTIMPHAMFGPKPWIRNYVLDALRGFPPGRVHAAYWRFANAPLRPFSPAAFRRKRLLLALGKLIGLLHVRSYRDL